MEEHEIGLEAVIDNEDLVEEDRQLEKDLHDDIYGLPPHDQYFFDEGMIEIQQAVEEIKDTPNNPLEGITIIEETEIIEIVESDPEYGDGDTEEGPWIMIPLKDSYY